VLLNAGKMVDAKALVPRIQKAARSPHDRLSADMLAEALESREAALRQAAQERAADNTVRGTVEVKSEGPKVAEGSSPGVPAKRAKGDELAVEGIILSAECNPDAVGRVTLSVNHVAMKFLYSSLNGLQVVGGVDGSQQTPACVEWKGKKVRLYFYATKNKPYVGELETVLFL
jgi:hypothetical protein